MKWYVESSYKGDKKYMEKAMSQIEPMMDSALDMVREVAFEMISDRAMTYGADEMDGDISEMINNMECPFEIVSSEMSHIDGEWKRSFGFRYSRSTLIVLEIEYKVLLRDIRINNILEQDEQ